MSKIAYITVNSPFGPQETFILSELLELRRSGVDLLILPRDRAKKLFHEQAKVLLDDTAATPRLSFTALWEFLKFGMLRPRSCMRLLSGVVLKSRNLMIALKNLAVLPKAVYLAAQLPKDSVSHIHAHWASTTATMAYVMSGIMNIPWSFTAHRWDIAENNLLREKCRSASFVRVISEKGRRELIDIVQDPSLTEKICVIHMGVPAPEDESATPPGSGLFSLVCPANLVAVKGHRYLIEACRALAEDRVRFDCLLAGDGPLGKDLKDLVRGYGLEGQVRFIGRQSQESLLNMYRSGAVHAVVLPSIVTEEGEKEGIPVALMEAMSYGIPVIATNTGAIPELIGDGSGIMVEEKNPRALAAAIKTLMEDRAYGMHIGGMGRKKIRREFNASRISAELASAYRSSLIPQDPGCSPTLWSTNR